MNKTEIDSVRAINIKNRIENIRKLAELLHLWHCHSDNCKGEHAEDCTFHLESWEPCIFHLESEPGLLSFARLKYYEKSERIYNQFKNFERAYEALMAFRILHPKLLIRLINEL